MMKIVIPGRRHMLALAAVVLLASCGSSTGETGSTSPSKTPPVIELPAPGGGVSASPGAAPAGASTESSDESRSSMMAWITYRYEGEMPTLDGPAGAWSYPSGAVPEDAQVVALAAALGIDGEVQAIPAEQGGGWSIGATDGTAPGLMVSANGMLDWWFNGGPSTVPAIDECTVADDGSTTCPEPTPLVGVPTGPEAQAKAEAIFTAAGYDLSNYELEASSSEWGAHVTAWLTLDGMRAPVQMSIGFGEKGAVTYANGQLAKPQRGADYPRIGAQAGLDRLIEQSSSFNSGVLARGGNAENPTPADEEEVNPQTQDPASSPMFPDAGVGDGVPCSMPGVEPAVDPLADPAAQTEALPMETPIDPSTDVGIQAPPDASLAIDPPDEWIDCGGVPQPIEVVLTGVTGGLTMVWANDNTIWLLPSYDFTDAGGGVYAVTAIDDAFLSYGDPVAATEVAPPGAAGDGTEEAQPPTEPVAPGLDCTQPTGYVVITDMTDAPAESEDGAEFVGLCLADSIAQAEAWGFSIREARRDGEDLALTMDARDNRFNVATVNGVVTEILSRG